ncbi:MULTISPECIES: copper chaperone PCu(A)C [Corynebacterium]|uniref:copper chaperone PCu(A)C n=1 Tax=Corynebacterium TaxID=1716 RepID=UPI00124C27E8|nr:MULTISPECIES: copper chaperone PCu(A)C [Corynebacterium]
MITRKFATVAAALLATGSLTLAACSPEMEKDSDMPKDPTDNPSMSSSAPASTESSETSTEASSKDVEFQNAYVKAKPADKSMTAVFGTLVNNTDQDILVTSFTTSLDAPKNEIHEVADGVMRELEGGLPIPANGEAPLQPGANHLMIMDYDKAIKPGDTVSITITLDDGTSYTFDKVEVRDIASGEESYDADGGVQGHSGMDHDHMDHDHDHS